MSCANEQCLPEAGDASSCSCCASHDHAHGHDDHGHSHGESHDPRRELIFLSICGVIYAAAMIAEDSIAASFGPWALYAIFGIPYVLCGFSVFGEAFTAMRKGDIFNEFTLMCGATVAAVCLGKLGEAVGVMLFYRIGEYVQDRALAGSRKSIRGLLASKPTTARVVEDGGAVEMPVEAVAVDAIVRVLPGEKIPLDGLVVSGSSQVDTAPLTGESVPVEVRADSFVPAGAINLEGAITVRVTAPFADTHMARILEMVEHAAARKSPTERFITRFARWYTPAVTLTAFAVAVLPPLVLPGATWGEWIYRALVMLVISCPCALLISIPLGYFGGIGAASRKGILVKGGNVLDAVLHVDTVIFDKTGTLTKGVFEVTAVEPREGVTADDLLRAAVRAEAHSNHPAARSIITYAAVNGLKSEIAEAESATVQAKEFPGMGLKVEVGGRTYLAGAGRLLLQEGLDPRETPTMGTVVYVAENDRVLGRIVVSDTIKPESQGAIGKLKSMGIHTHMLTGDNEAAAAFVARETGLDGFEAGLMPDGKVDAAGRLGDPARIAFVGDGINDAPILALSRVGIAMGRLGAEAAVEAADVVILNDSPAKIPDLLTLARKVRRVVRENIVLALGVKLAFMALGVVGIAGLWEAVFADVGVALLAVLNAVRTMRG